MAEDNRSAQIVAIILASGIVIALNIVTIALLYVAYTRLGQPGVQGLSENGTQLLTGWGGGIIGVLGAYVGYAFGKRSREKDDDG
jgi:hypothetical protein